MVKKSAFEGTAAAYKNLKACKYCNYRYACRMIRDEPERCKSLTSVVHKGFKNLKLYVSEPTISWHIWDGEPKVKYDPPEVYAKLSNEGLLKKALKGTEWKYTPEFARKTGWKQLYADAVESHKLEKELDFWGL
jgi:hypothetical protein